MKWQEYQEAVAELFESADGIGRVTRDVRLPDLDTGSPRQIDALLEIQSKFATVRVVIDAKMRVEALDVKDVEEVAALAEAVGIGHAIIVASSGWTAPAAEKARRLRVDLRVMSIEDALELVVPERWKLCPACERDCIVFEHENALPVETGTISIFMAGRCRSCGFARFWCWDCGVKEYVAKGKTWRCDCGHHWRAGAAGLAVRVDGAHAFVPLEHAGIF